MNLDQCLPRQWQVTAAVCLLLLFLSPQPGRATEADEEKLVTLVQADLKRHDFNVAIRRSQAAAKHSSPAMTFGTGLLYVMRAYDLRKHQAPRAQVRRAENRALLWIKLAARGGNLEARNLAGDIRRHGRRAMYFPSLDHLMPD